ncbi:hypothetical protein BC828DRAFT_371900 [Blastocladiella britannica]|nr:hypothetical protein BC828DRAFT_371900 [Blastocladiella britannica]
MEKMDSTDLELRISQLKRAVNFGIKDRGFARPSSATMDLLASLVVDPRTDYAVLMRKVADIFPDRNTAEREVEFFKWILKEAVARGLRTSASAAATAAAVVSSSSSSSSSRPRASSEKDSESRRDKRREKKDNDNDNDSRSTSRRRKEEPSSSSSSRRKDRSRSRDRKSKDRSRSRDRDNSRRHRRSSRDRSSRDDRSTRDRSRSADRESRRRTGSKRDEDESTKRDTSRESDRRRDRRTSRDRHSSRGRRSSRDRDRDRDGSRTRPKATEIKDSPKQHRSGSRASILRTDSRPPSAARLSPAPSSANTEPTSIAAATASRPSASTAPLPPLITEPQPIPTYYEVVTNVRGNQNQTSFDYATRALAYDVFNDFASHHLAANYVGGAPGALATPFSKRTMGAAVSAIESCIVTCLPTVFAPPSAAPYPHRPSAALATAAFASAPVASALPQYKNGKSRCRHWPHCYFGTSYGECKYYHPEAVCEAYPGCPYADEQCMSIHPRYFASVTDARSNLYGSTLDLAGALKAIETKRRAIATASGVQPPSVAAVAPAAVDAASAPAATSGAAEGVPCRFGLQCTRRDCPYTHPATADRFATEVASSATRVHTGAGWAQASNAEYMDLDMYGDF